MLMFPIPTIQAKSTNSAIRIEDCVTTNPSFMELFETRNGTKVYWRSPAGNGPGEVIIAPRRGCSINISGVVPARKPLTVGFLGILMDGDPPSRFYPNSVGRVQMAILARTKKLCDKFPVEFSEKNPGELGFSPTPYESCIIANSQRVNQQSDLLSFFSAWDNPDFQVLVAVFRGCLLARENIVNRTGSDKIGQAIDFAIEGE